MPTHRRANVRYNPIIDAQLRWPDWDFALTFIRNGTEYIDLEHKVFYLDIREWGLRRAAGIAHGIAHLDLDHHRLDLDDFTDQNESDATDLAVLRLDRSKGTGMINNVNSI